MTINFKTLLFAAMATLILPVSASATKFLELKAVDKDYVMVHFRDGEVRFRDDGSGPGAFLGHTYTEGDDSLFIFGKRLDGDYASKAEWKLVSADGVRRAVEVSRKAKPMNLAHDFSMELDHWIFLKLDRPLVQGQTYRLEIPEGLGSDVTSAELDYDIFNSMSEAIHVNIIGYVPSQPVKLADLYLWLGDGGQRDYRPFEGKKVYLYNVGTGEKKVAGEVRFWMGRDQYKAEGTREDLTGSDVWSIDFSGSEPGRYRIAVEDVGCSMDFEISDDIYYQPYRYSVRGYYFMRVGEPNDPSSVTPIPRQPRFIPGVEPEGFMVYKTDLTPWSPEWRRLRMDVWDEPHFKAPEASIFWQHRLEGNPVNMNAVGGHSDAYDWDRHLAHVSNIYDLLLPYFLTGGRLDEDGLGIRESGNGIPDIVDEARNEVDFFLSIRDGEAYSQGLTNPSKDWKVMFQAGCTTMAAWANAANCAMLADCFRIAGNDPLMHYYTDEAVKAFRFAEKQENSQLDDFQALGTSGMRGRDFMQMAAAFLYNVTGDRSWEDIMAAESVPERQIWGTAAYLGCPRERHYGQLYSDMKAAVDSLADSINVGMMDKRPSRRSSSDRRFKVAENMHLVMMAHYIAGTPERKAQLERSLYAEAGWGLGRNPSNTVEMTGLGERCLMNIYANGRNDGYPGTHPGQTPFNGTEVWTVGDGGDSRILLRRCYPDWNEGGWPRQEAFFENRYIWVNAEFTPRETMRGKMALLGYLYGIR
ncbi:MAG: glycoside hydrolase family 9 protein [Bacteroidales bacterium]|nr:glycoside hydrolase family 9 protein [Bacteroidales bacterium]